MGEVLQFRPMAKLHIEPKKQAGMAWLAMGLVLGYCAGMGVLGVMLWRMK
jgi:hypothetical protein